MSRQLSGLVLLLVLSLFVFTASAVSGGRLHKLASMAKQGQLATDTQPCVNSSPNCASWVANGFCTSNFYTAAQKAQYCALSCGLCTGSSGSCVDTNTNCPTWVNNGFCTNKFYTDAQKKQYCAKSCDMCTPE